jgi:VWFA-related protein
MARSLLVLSLALTTVVAVAQQKPPVFRSGVDLRQLDVTVLDKNRRPVTGLTAADFSVVEDNVPQKIEAFSFVDLGDAVPRVEPVWAAKAASDVVTNDLDAARVFLLIIDDVFGMGDLWAKNQLPKSVATFVSQLGPDDVAAVVFTGRSDLSVNFTRDKAKLAKAADWFLDSNQTTVGAVGSCRVQRIQPETFLYAAQNLGTMKNRRKAIVFFGGRMTFCTGSSDCGECELWEKYVQVARESNVSVYPVDTMGLRPWRPGGFGGAARQPDGYLSLADYVGGRALINNNSFTEGLARIYAENTSYYLLAYQPTNPEDDGRFRRVIVKVNRPDVEVMSTRSYWAPKPASPKRPAPPPLSPDAEALSGVLPRSQLPLRATAAPFRADGQAAGVVALSVRLSPPAFLERTRENVELLIRTLTLDGGDYGTDRQLIPVTVPTAPEGAMTSTFEVLARVDVPKPGRYELRLSAHSESNGSRGSIFVDVDVPDFKKDKLSLSGIVVNNAVTTTPVAPPRLLREVVPMAPTTERSFTNADIVTTLLRVYQGGNDKLAAVTMKVTILDATGKPVFNQTDPVAVESFGTDRSAEHQFRVPLNKLEKGEYLMAFEATAGKNTARRDVRFERK